MRAYGDPLMDYSRSPRHDRKNYTYISRSKPSLVQQSYKNSKNLVFGSTYPNNNYNKQNAMVNCRSTVNILPPSQNYNAIEIPQSKGTKKRSSSFLNKSQAVYTSQNSYNLPSNRYKTKSKWQTTQYPQNYPNENYDSNLETVINKETQNKYLSPNNGYLQKVTKYRSQNDKLIYDKYFQNKNLNNHVKFEDNYPKFGNQEKQLKQQIDQNSRNRNNLPLYQRIKGYNDNGFSTIQSESYMYKTYSHQNNYNQLCAPKKIMTETLGGYKYKQIIDKYDCKNKLIDMYSPRQKNQVQTLQLTKKISIKSDQHKQPQLSDFLIGQCKGEGRFGKVYMAIHKKTGFLCALKKIKKQSVKYMMDQFIQQIKIQLYLNHPKLLKIYGYFCDKQNFYMLIQYMEEGSLYSLMKKNKKFQEKEAAEKLNQICEGIKEMHSHNIVHRDLKPENVVISNGVCKICDFGWAAICQDRRQTYCGTLDYVCPEIVQGNSYDSSVDIWCIGVLAYELLCGKAPFYDISRQKTIQKIKSCKIDNFPPHLSRKAINFIQMILKKDPNSRVGIQQLLHSQFIRQVRK